MKRLLTSLLVLVAMQATAQPTAWPIVVSEGHFAFPLPPSMELQAGTFESAEAAGDEYFKVAGNEFAVMAQPKGYRRSDPENFRMPSATILVRIDQGEAGTYATLGANLSMPAEELEQLDNDLRTGFISEGEARGELSNVDWIGTEVVQLEGTQAIRFRYSADVGPNSDRMAVNTYLVQNDAWIYYITLSYLVAEQKKWVDDLTTAMEAIRFEKR